MPATTPGGTPYAVPADPVQQWPATSQSVALKVDEKVKKAGDTMTGQLVVPSLAIKLTNGNGAILRPGGANDYPSFRNAADTAAVPVLVGEPDTPAAAVTKAYADAIHGGVLARGATRPINTGTTWTTYPLATSFKFGSAALTGTTEVTSSGYFRCSKTGLWRFDVLGVFSATSDSFRVSGSQIISVEGDQYVQGGYVLTSATGNARAIVGVRIQGTPWGLQEMHYDMTPAGTIETVYMEVSAEYLGPSV